MVDISEPSVKSLKIEMRFSGQSLATGSAFVVDSAKGPLLITNRHNFTGRHQETGECLSDMKAIPNEVLIVHHKSHDSNETLEKIEPILDESESPIWYEHPTLGQQADIVALPLTNLEGVGINPYDLSENPGIWIGVAERVSVVGFPFGLSSTESYAVWATGFIASEPDADFDGLPVFLIDCRTRQGQSGSAVIAHRGGGNACTNPGVFTVFEEGVSRFLGIYSGRVNPNSDIGIVWKASAIQDLVSNVESA